MRACTLDSKIALSLNNYVGISLPCGMQLVDLGLIAYVLKEAEVMCECDLQFSVPHGHV
jgi:hypothetical protein